MDAFDKALNFLFSLPSVASWSEMVDLLRDTASKRPQHWLLAEAACLAVGGTRERAVPGVAATGCFHTSMILLDDIMDNDPKGEFQKIGAGPAANLACGLQSAGYQTINLSDLDEERKLTSVHILSNMMLTSTFGQSVDARNPQDEETYWQIVKTKSSPFFSAAFQLGGLLGGFSTVVSDHLKEFGEIYGELIQIYDDINDTLAVPASQDWILGRSSLPILFAQTVDHSEREYFLALRGEVSNPEKLAEAQGILLRCGAISYCVDQLVVKYQKARQILGNMQLSDPYNLEELLDVLIQPIWKMFDGFCPGKKGVSRTETPSLA